MAKDPKSEIEDLVSEIMKRDQTRPRPADNPHLAELSKLRSDHIERLQSELAEVGLDFEKLEKRYDKFRKETDKLYGKLTPPDDRKPF
jgi:hypothetical protein